MKNTIFNIKNDTTSITNVGSVRKENEDNLGFAETPNGDIFVVCDGMGGHVGGKEASTVAVDSIMQYFSQEKKADIYSAMDEAIRFANTNVYEKALENPELKGMGTTIVLLVVQTDKIYIAHVGDSRIYLLTKERLHNLTKDHSYVQGLFDRGILTLDELANHSRKNEITKALGLKPNVVPEVSPEPILLKNNDIILMCSDGLNDMVNDRTIQNVLKKDISINEKGEELINLALNAGGKDNITLQLIKVTNSNYIESIFIDKSNSELQITLDIPLEQSKEDFNTTVDNFSQNNDEGIKPSNKNKFILIALVLIFLIVAAISYFMLFNNSYVVYTIKNTKYKKVEAYKDLAGAKIVADSLMKIDKKDVVIVYKNDTFIPPKFQKIQNKTFDNTKSKKKKETKKTNIAPKKESIQKKTETKGKTELENKNTDEESKNDETEKVDITNQKTNKQKKK